MLTMNLGGFMSRQWHNATSGAKFRKQIRKRAARTGGRSQSIEIRDESGFMVDYYMCDDEYQDLLHGDVDVDYQEKMLLEWRKKRKEEGRGNLW